EARRDYYRDIAFMIPRETAGMTLSSLAISQEGVAGVSDALASILSLVPEFASGTAGYLGTPVAVTTQGGAQLARAASATASLARSTAAVFGSTAAALQTYAGFERRQEEWTLQETLAKKELDQIEKQIRAARIREAIAADELKNHGLQTDNAQE